MKMRKRILGGIVMAAAALSCVFFPAAAQEEQSVVWSQDFESSAITGASGAAALLRRQIAKTPNPEQYIVVGLIGGKEGDWNHTEQTLQAEFGEHYLDVKSYLASEQALQDAGFAPTGQDRTDLTEGRVPASLRTDSVHLNDAGYKLLAQNIYKKLVDLKYIENKI